jgi:hypothetical protein
MVAIAYNPANKHQREMKIELELYEHTCADGCCYTTGYDVFVDGEKIGSIDEDAQELADLLNETFNTKERLALLPHLVLILISLPRVLALITPCAVL